MCAELTSHRGRAESQVIPARQLFFLRFVIHFQGFSLPGTGALPSEKHQGKEGRGFSSEGKAGLGLKIPTTAAGSSTSQKWPPESQGKLSLANPNSKKTPHQENSYKRKGLGTMGPRPASDGRLRTPNTKRVLDRAEATAGQSSANGSVDETILSIQFFLILQISK